MNVLFPRAINTCTGDKQWYVCSAGPFRGCCSSDPCTTGICPDDELTTTSSTETTSTSTSTSSTTSSRSTPSSSTSPEIAQTTPSPTSSATEATSLDNSTSSLTVSATSTATTIPVSTETKSSNNAIIGGVVGSVAGLVLCTALWFCWRRRRREQSFNIVSLRQSETAQSLHEQRTPSPVKTNPRSSVNDIRLLNDTDSFPSLPDLALSTTGSRANTSISGPDSWSLSTPGLTGGPSESSTLTSGMNMSMSMNTLSTTRDLPQLPPSSELLASIPRGAGFTPELPDTGFYRQRAELATHSQSELINVPLYQRLRRSPQKPPRPGFQPQKCGSRSWDSSPSTSATMGSYPSPSTSTDTSATSPRLMSRQMAHRVVTTEGVVLGANLDRYSVPTGLETEQGVNGEKSERNVQDHVMSFMTFENDVEMTDGSDLEHRDGDGDTSGRVDGTIAWNARSLAVLGEDCFSPMSDVPPAYESGGFSPRDVKSPSATTGLGSRG